MAQSTIFPTLFDLMGLRWAPAVADLDTFRLRNQNFTVRNRNRHVNNNVFDISSSSVDEFLRIPPAEHRADLYRSQETIPDVHPNGYRGPGLNYRNSRLREGYDPTMTNPESRFIPSESRETNPPDLDQNPVLPNVAPPAGFGPAPAIELNLPQSSPAYPAPPPAPVNPAVGFRGTSSPRGTGPAIAVQPGAASRPAPRGAVPGGAASRLARALFHRRDGPEVAPPLNGPTGTTAPRTPTRPDPTPPAAFNRMRDDALSRSAYVVPQPTTPRTNALPRLAEVPSQSCRRPELRIRLSQSRPISRKASAPSVATRSNPAKTQAPPVAAPKRTTEPKKWDVLSRIRGTND